jgi:peptidylprolyl isomerase
METAKKGDTVSVHYTGRLTDGTVFDSSRNGDPLTFELGGGQLIQGFDQAVMGMEIGETKTVELAPSEAYGARRDDLEFEMERSNFPESIEPEEGQQLQMRQRNGQPLIVTVIEANEETVTLDANHPLAGEELVFDIELVEIK